MTDREIKGLGYETAGQILGALAGRGMGFAAADLAGEIFWHCGDPPDLETCRAVRAAVSRASESDDTGKTLGDRGSVTISPICDPADTPRAWFAAWSSDDIDGETGSSEWKRVTETLPRVTSMLSREYKLAGELSGAVHELGERYEELNLVYRIERESRTNDHQSEVVRAMFDGFLEHMRVDVGVFIARESELSYAARGTERPIANADLVLTELRGRVWRFLSTSGKPVVINDADDERRAYLLSHMPFKLLAVPNEGCGESDAGILLLRHHDAPDFSNSDASLARVFFGQAMMLMRHQAMLAKMGRFTRQIASSLVEAVEAKDPYTRGHSERVEHITGRLGQDAGIAEKDHADLMWGALLHDIGKIGIPDSILMKPSRLTVDEYTFIKTHPGRSYDILQHIEQLGPVALDGARYHQEKFDGTGYPFGLAGSEIPLAARVVSVADTYDAVTSSRSYRAARSHEDAVEIIRGASGSQLDPEIVALFMQIVDGDADWRESLRINASFDNHG